MRLKKARTRTHGTVAPNRTARGLATMGLYEIVEALLLLTNAVAILNEDRFLAPCKPCSRLSTPAVSVRGILLRSFRILSCLGFELVGIRV